MDEQRPRSNKAFVGAWLLTLGFALAVGPFGSPATTEECGSGAACAPSKKQLREDRLQLREWRGKEPRICLVKGCDHRPPTFCQVARHVKTAPDLGVPGDRDACTADPRFRTARIRGS